MVALKIHCANPNTSRVLVNPGTSLSIDVGAKSYRSRLNKANLLVKSGSPHCSDENKYEKAITLHLRFRHD
jgi:hypothetical protein